MRTRLGIISRYWRKRKRRPMMMIYQIISWIFSKNQKNPQKISNSNRE